MAASIPVHSPDGPSAEGTADPFPTLLLRSTVRAVEEGRGVPKRRMRRAPVASAWVLAVVLAGCSSTASPATPSPPAGRATADPAQTSSPAPTPRSEVGAAITAAQPTIVDENLHAGSSDWRMGGAGNQVGTDIGGEIKGYASDASVNVGQPITLFVSVSPAQSFKIDIYRLGWYGGTGGRLVVGGTWLPGVTQDACPIEAGLRACSWQPTIRFTVPTSWVSGVYLAILTNERHFQNAVHFVVRDDASTSPLLYVQPVTTYQAYNPWPHDGSGRSLYATTRVSFDRPYADDGIARSFFDFEQPFVAWLERAGYQVTYATSIDLDRQGAALLRHIGSCSLPATTSTGPQRCGWQRHRPWPAGRAWRSSRRTTCTGRRGLKPGLTGGPTACSSATGPRRWIQSRRRS